MEWNIQTSILWEKIPNNIALMMKEYTKECKDRCIVRKVTSKHKYIYILGKNKSETKFLKNKFKELNPKLINLSYPKERGK